MHDPSTVAFEIKRPWPQRSGPKKEHVYYPALVTIWHVDPETDGTDDSCGWFIRGRHADQVVLKAIEKDFAFEWESEWGGWFNADGNPRLSVQAIAINMFSTAIHRMTEYNWDLRKKFMRKHLYDILYFAENNVDSMRDGIMQKYGSEAKPDRIRRHAVMVYTWILRAQRPWYKHPRWHIWHWKLQIHPLQKFKRWAFARCASCGKGFSWGYCPVSVGWYGNGPTWFGESGVRHSDCRNPDSDGANQAKVAQA